MNGIWTQLPVQSLNVPTCLLLTYTSTGDEPVHAEDPLMKNPAIVRSNKSIWIHDSSSVQTSGTVIAFSSNYFNGLFIWLWGPKRRWCQQSLPNNFFSLSLSSECMCMPWNLYISLILLCPNLDSLLLWFMVCSPPASSWTLSEVADVSGEISVWQLSLSLLWSSCRQSQPICLSHVSKAITWQLSLSWRQWF